LLIILASSFLSINTLMVQYDANAESEETDDWAMFRHDAQHSGYSTSTAPNTNQTLWNYTTGGNVYSSPAVVDDKVYIGSSDAYINCINATTGAYIWSYPTSGPVSSSPAVANGVVYVGSEYGQVYAFRSPSLKYFDNFFKHNNVRMIYPEQTSKPLGCVAAMVSDWLASGFIYTKLQTVVEGTDTDAAFVNQTTGKPLGATGTGIVSFGGPIVNLVVAYAENASNSTADRAPLKFYSNASAGSFYFQHQDGTSIPGANLPISVINNNMDIILVEVYLDSDGRNIMLCYGFGWKGTYAAGKYFLTEIYPNIANYSYSWIIVKWEDTNANGFVNITPDGDTYTVIATG
jgi:hypothetical protein